MYENEECDGYNKNRIINMLLVHDMAEAYTGDIPYGLKTEQDKEIEKKPDGIIMHHCRSFQHLKILL
mgnify:CR=1 FL=1